MRVELVSRKSFVVPTSHFLWRVAEDPTVDDTARVGAAIALRSDASDSDRERLKAIASGTASPKIRVALEAVESEADLEAAVSELER